MPKRAPKTDAGLAVGYVRVSTEEQALGPAAQRAAIERWAAAHGAQVVSWHEDIGVSGATPIERRPGLLAALEALSAYGAGHLVVAKRDRLARDTLQAALSEQLVQRRGAVITSAGNGAENGDAPEAQLMRAMADAFAQFERALIRQRTTAALAAKRARGERTGGIPWGMQLAADGVALAPHAGEQAVIASVRQLRAGGASHRQIVRALAASGVLARSGRPLGLAQVQRILAAPE